MRYRNHTGKAKVLGGRLLPYGGWQEVQAAEQVVYDAYRLGYLDLLLSPTDALRTDTVHWKSPFSLADGYATAAENMTLALDRLGVRLYLEPVWFDDHTGLQPWTREKLREPFGGFCEVGVCMSTPGEFKTLPTRVRVGYTMYEADDPLEKYPEWRHDCDRADLLVVPTEYCRGVFGEFFRRDIVVAPLALNALYYAPKLRQAKDTFTFVSYGTLSGRKSPLETIRCFQRAFPTEDDVRLVLKTRFGVCGYSYHQLPKLDDDRITIVNVEKKEPDWSPETLRDWLYDADCMVFLSKGEGYGLPPREAAATGLPLIYAHNSGLSDITYGYGVRTLKEEASPIGGAWRVPDWDMATDLMRHVYLHREKAYAQAYREALDMAERRDDGPLQLKSVLEDVGRYSRRTPAQGDTLKDLSAHDEFYDVVEETMRGRQGAILDVGVGEGLAYVALTKRGYDVYGVTEDPQSIEKVRAAGVTPKIRLGPLNDLRRSGFPDFALCVSQGVLQDKHHSELPLIVGAAEKVAPLLFSVPSVHYPHAFSEQARLGWRKEWDDLLTGYARQLRYYAKKRYLMGLVSGKAQVAKPNGTWTRDGVWRAYEGDDD
jgi:hypothetical protein